MLSINIKKLRGEKGLSQDFLASKLGISRPTYMQIEKGERDVTLTEAQKLSEIFNITLDELIENKIKSQPKISLEKDGARVEKESEIRISIPQKNIKKFKQVLLYVLSKVGAKPNVGETVLYKLLYFIDFDFYEKFEKQLTGATYIKNHYGPTPVEFKFVIEEMQMRGEIEVVKSKYFQHEQKKYLPRVSPDLTELGAQETAHIDEVLARLSDKSAMDLSNYSHEDVPWQVHKQGEAISYESVFYRDHKYSVRTYTDEL